LSPGFSEASGRALFFEFFRQERNANAESVFIKKAIKRVFSAINFATLFELHCLLF